MLPLEHKRPLGWPPGIDEDLERIDPYTFQATDRNPCFPITHSASLSQSDQASSPSTINKTSRRHHFPGWIARPRNAFILFRCEYSQAHCKRGRRIRRPPGTSSEPSLSKRAAIAWSQMTSEEKEPYMLRAEEERIEHARKHPEYRFRPQRRGRYSLRRSRTTSSSQSEQGERQIVVLPSPVPSGHANPHPLISSGFSLEPRSLEIQTSVSGWKLPPSCDMPRDNLDYDNSTAEIASIPFIGRTLDSQILPRIPEPELKGPFDVRIDELLSEPITSQTLMPLDLDCTETTFFEHAGPNFEQDYQTSFPLYVMPPKLVSPPFVDSNPIQSLYFSGGLGSWPWNFTSQSKCSSACSADTYYDDIPAIGMVESPSNFDSLTTVACRY